MGLCNHQQIMLMPKQLHEIPLQFDHLVRNMKLYPKNLAVCLYLKQINLLSTSYLLFIISFFKLKENKEKYLIMKINFISKKTCMYRNKYNKEKAMFIICLFLYIYRVHIVNFYILQTVQSKLYKLQNVWLIICSKKLILCTKMFCTF
jgi:hypothetical protein